MLKFFKEVKEKLGIKSNGSSSTSDMPYQAHKDKPINRKTDRLSTGQNLKYSGKLGGYGTSQETVNPNQGTSFGKGS